MKGRHFDPQHLTTDASINRLVIATSPGVPARLASQRAYDLLSAEAVAGVAGGHGLAVPREAIADGLSAALRSRSEHEREAARTTAAEVGLRLACLLATLRLPDTAETQGWNGWRRAYLRHWAAVGKVQLAGGLLAGDFGRVVVEMTSSALVRLGVPTRATLSPWPAWAALIGAARRLGPDGGEVVAVDLGASRVKSAVVRTLPGGAVELAHPTTTPVPFGSADEPSRETLEDLLAAVLGAAAQNARGLGADIRAVAISVACYLEQDARCARRGVYANLPDLRDVSWHRRLVALYGRPMPLGITHDGTAAAASLSGRDASDATLVMGSAIGVGFRPANLRR